MLRWNGRDAVVPWLVPRSQDQDIREPLACGKGKDRQHRQCTGPQLILAFHSGGNAEAAPIYTLSAVAGMQALFEQCKTCRELMAGNRRVAPHGLLNSPAETTSPARFNKARSRTSSCRASWMATPPRHSVPSAASLNLQFDNSLAQFPPVREIAIHRIQRSSANPLFTAPLRGVPAQRQFLCGRAGRDSHPFSSGARRSLHNSKVISRWQGANSRSRNGASGGSPVLLLRSHIPIRKITAMLGFRWPVSGFCAVIYLCRQIKPAMKAFVAAHSATMTSIREPDVNFVKLIISPLLSLWKTIERIKDSSNLRQVTQKECPNHYTCSHSSRVRGAIPIEQRHVLPYRSSREARAAPFPFSKALQ